MKIGLQLPNFGTAGGTAAMAPRMREIAEAAEAGGFASLWVMDPSSSLTLRRFSDHPAALAGILHPSHGLPRLRSVVI